MSTTTKAAERLAKMRERASGKATYVEPTIEANNSDFTAQRWYDAIVDEPTIEKVREAGAYYSDAIKDGQHYVVPVGNLSTLLQQYPGIMFFYQGILVDCQQARRWLESKTERLEAERHNHYMYSEEAKAEYGAVKTTDAAKLAKADPSVIALVDGARLLAYHEHNLERLMEAFENIKYVLNHIVTIRKEKLEEVWVDPTKETSSE